MSANIDDFVAELRPYLNDCPDFIIEDMVIKVLSEVCTKTRCWQTTLAAVDVVAGTASYASTPPANSVVVEVLKVIYSDLLLSGYDMETLDTETPAWRASTGPSATHYLGEAADTIRLIPTPTEDVTGALVVRVALRPTKTTTTVDDLLYKDEILPTVLAGTLAKLMLMPKKWADPNLAVARGAEYRRGLTDILNWVERGYGKRSLTIKPQLFC